MNTLEEKIKEILHCRRPLEKKLEEIMLIILNEQKIIFYKTKNAYKDCAESDKVV